MFQLRLLICRTLTFTSTRFSERGEISLKALEDLKELYMEEIKKINKKGDLTPVDSEAACKALEAIKKIDEICCNSDYEDEMDEGHSERMYPRRYPMSRRMPDMMHIGYGYDRSYDRSYDKGYSDGYNRSHDRGYSDGYTDSYSERRGRSMTTGRYISRHAAPEVDGMIHKLEGMRVEAPNSEIRMAIDNMIEKLENY